MPNAFSVSVLRPGAPEAFSELKNTLAVSLLGISVIGRLTKNKITLELSGEGDAVVTVWLKLYQSDLFPMIPGFMTGHNRPEDTGLAVRSYQKNKTYLHLC